MTWIWLPPSLIPPDIDHGIFPVRFARHDLVLLGDVHRRLHTGQRREHFLGQRTFIPDRADHRALDAARYVCFQSCRLKSFDHCTDLFIGDISSHYDNHCFSPRICCNADKNFSFSDSSPMLTRK